MESSPKLLATDLDGTLIPLEGDAEHPRSLEELPRELEAEGIDLAFVTGRHLGLVREAMADHDLPRPAWIICDVGTSVYSPGSDDAWDLNGSYQDHLAGLVEGWDVGRTEGLLGDVTGLRKQEPEKQGRFKLSYYCDAGRLEELVGTIEPRLDSHGAPYRVIASVDPFTDDGLIDLLPEGVSKSYALDWLVRHCGLRKGEVVFAGDSGNDLAALTAGYHSIVVANAADDVVRQAEAAHREAGWDGRLYLAEGTATSGVLEGLRHFLGRPVRGGGG